MSRTVVTVPPTLFAEIDDIVRSIVDPALGELQSRTHRYGTKVWFGDETPGRLHFEAQVLRRSKVDGGDGLAVEIGFHAELKKEADNEATLAALVAAESTWRPTLGGEATAGIFFDAAKWRRLSDVWLEPDFDDEDAAFEIASRLVDYLSAIQPLLTDAATDG